MQLENFTNILKGAKRLAILLKEQPFLRFLETKISVQDVFLVILNSAFQDRQHESFFSRPNVFLEEHFKLFFRGCLSYTKIGLPFLPPHIEPFPPHVKYDRRDNQLDDCLQPDGEFAHDNCPSLFGMQSDKRAVTAHNLKGNE